MTGARLVTVLAAAVTLAACASPSGNWQHDTRPESQWAQDESECRTIAARRTDEEFAGLEDRLSNARGTTGRQTTNFDRLEARESRRRHFARCMRNRGYRQVRVENEE